MTTERRKMIRTMEDMAHMVEQYGFLPFFPCNIPGFSIEENTAREIYFKKDVDGPWEWKGPVIRLTGAAYGKFFPGKAGFVSKKLFPHFANWRRDGYDIDARFNDGLARTRDLKLVQTLERIGPSLSKTLKTEAGYSSKKGEGGLKGFDSAITRMQEQCYIITSDFVYMRDRNGKEYGWGVAEYSTPEQRYGNAFTDAVYSCSPEESFEIIVGRLKDNLGSRSEKSIRELLK